MPMQRELYPDDWEEIAMRVKTQAGWRCEMCGHPHDEVRRLRQELQSIITDRDERAKQKSEFFNEIERLREKVRLLHDATIVLRNGMGGHNHWDPTQRRGAGCVICQMQREARQRADDLITQCGMSEQ